MRIEDRFELMLQPKDRKSRLANLDRLIQELISEGNNRGQIEKLFSDFAAKLRAANREEDEDLINDKLDIIVGWCPPDKHIKGLDYENEAN